VYGPWAEIHLDRLRANFNAIAAFVSGAKVLAVVKADGYGHGMVPIAKTLAGAGVFGFGVATLPEALELRGAGLKNPILHMGRFDPLTLAEYVNHDIRMTIHANVDLGHLSEYHDGGGQDITAHLKIDTGMGRLGVPYDHAIEVMEAIKPMSWLRLEGIYSHFATADEADQSFMRYQLARFSQFVHMVRKIHLDVEYFHAANSSALVRETDSHFNMVRPGLLLYGVRPSEHVQPTFEVQPVMDLKAPLILVKKMRKGSPVGYGRAYHATEETNIGTIQLGYHDGLPTNLANRGLIELGGNAYTLAGRVSMDLCNLALGDDDPEPGSEALIWGLSDHPGLDVSAQAALAGRNPYELLTNVGKRVERRYVEN